MARHEITHYFSNQATRQEVRIRALMRKVFECNDETEINNIHFNVGFTQDHIIKTIRWLFIEQDIRNWNYSGRYMTWGLVPDVE